MKGDRRRRPALEPDDVLHVVGESVAAGEDAREFVLGVDEEIDRDRNVIGIIEIQGTLVPAVAIGVRDDVRRPAKTSARLGHT